MPHPSRQSVVLSQVSFAWPDGSAVFDDVDAALGAGRTGLIGANGVGKTTLLKLIASELHPTAGRIDVTGEIGYLPQDLALRASDEVADVLGVRARLDALAAIEGGSTDTTHFDALAGDWGVAERAEAALAGLGLGHLALDRSVTTLSGGEAVLAALAGLWLAEPSVVLLDEPTNNLDRPARQRLYEAIDAWRGAVVVVSHDVALLALMDDIAELRRGSLTTFGGGYAAFVEHRDQELQAADQALRSAQQRLRTEQRQRIEAQTKVARRQRYGRDRFEQGGMPKILLNARKSAAQVSAGKLRATLDERVAAASREVDEKELRARRDETVSIDIPDPRVPAGRRLAELRDITGRVFVVQGPLRVALTGRNGGGKTRLLTTLVEPGLSPEAPGRAGSSTGAPLPQAATPAAGTLPEAAPEDTWASDGSDRKVASSFTAEEADLRKHERPANLGGTLRRSTSPGSGLAVAVAHTGRIGYLPQRLDHLAGEASIYDAVRAAAPNAAPGQIRANLARFFFRGDAIHRRIGDLSGGERFRAALAVILLADPPNELLVLDEPTNSLDLASVDELVGALDGYRGGLLVVSHDDAFLARLRLDTCLELDRGVLTETRPPAPAEGGD